jgi:hypothetical protein
MMPPKAAGNFFGGEGREKKPSFLKKLGFLGTGYGTMVDTPNHSSRRDRILPAARPT